MSSKEITEIFKSKGVFKSAPICPIYKPGQTEYERSVATSNLLFRFSRPAGVVQPRNAAEVQSIISKARAHKIPITIKNGGHSYSGASTASKGILLDLCKMKSTSLHMGSKTVTVQGGALWGHAYKKLVNGKYNEYIINGGRCPTVGVSGFILGGGLGPFTRSFGMGCDNVKEISIVTADGELVKVTDKDDPKSKKGQLFWALRGAGSGNFGVVVEMKLYLQKLKNKDGVVVGGRYNWFPRPGGMNDFMSTMRSFYTADWSRPMTIDTTWMMDAQGGSGEPAVRFIVYYNGNKTGFDDEIDMRIRNNELARQLKRRSLPEKSSRFFHETLVSQWSEETKKAFPSNQSYSIYTSFVFINEESRIRNITSILRSEMYEFRRQFAGEQGQMQMTFIHSGGKAKDKERGDTAFRWRPAIYHAYLMLSWTEKWLERDMRGFRRKFKERLREYSMQGHAVFANFPDGSMDPEMHEIAYYGDNRQKLRLIKRMWDPSNFFQWSQGIRLPARKKMESAKLAIGGAADDSDDGAPDNDSDEEKILQDEEELTDEIASREWENFPLCSTSDDFFGSEWAR